MVNLCNAVPVVIDNINNNELTFDIEDIKNAISNRAKAI